VDDTESPRVGGPAKVGLPQMRGLRQRVDRLERDLYDEHFGLIRELRSLEAQMRLITWQGWALLVSFLASLIAILVHGGVF